MDTIINAELENAEAVCQFSYKEYVVSYSQLSKPYKVCVFPDEYFCDTIEEAIDWINDDELVIIDD